MAITPEMAALKTRLKATWMAGDYAHFAQYLELGALEFLGRIEAGPGTRMLDVACGAGRPRAMSARCSRFSASTLRRQR
jgi:trans-aconitate methyltransferase